MDELTNQVCPLCKEGTLTLTEDEKEIPYFGKCFLFSMSCSNCKYHKADIEAAERKGYKKYIFTIENKQDLNVRVVKSSEATIKIPQLKVSMTPGPASMGYITNTEGILSRFKHIIEQEKELAEDLETKKKAKNLLKKIWKVENGDLKLKIILEDPSGNSAIISEKATVK